MKNFYLFLMMLLVSVTSTFAQTTETFESETAGATAFTDNGQTFNITSQSGGTFSIFDYNTIGGMYGWNGTAADFKSIDNTNQALIGVPAGFTIKSPTGFLLKSFYLLALREDLSPASGTCVITGKLSGITQFTVSSSSFNTDLNVMNGFTLIDMSVFGGQNNSNNAIDELIISTTGSTYETLALDAWKWQKIVAPTVTTTMPATSIGATKATAGGNVTADGGATVTARGIVWATTTNPTTANNTVTSGSGTGLFSSTLSGLPAATLIYYRAFATNGAGTSYGASASFTTSAALAASQSYTNVSCNSGTNGTATVTASGGVSPYTYLWSNAATNATATGLATGNYNCTITDSESTVLVKSFTITQPTAISGTTVVTNISCNGGTNGAINLTATGGTPGYTYNWGGGITTEDRTGLAAGSYSVIITDANGCTKTLSSIIITQPTALTGTTVVTNVSCNGGTNGAINLTATGGTPGYTFNWGGGITTEDRTGLAAGSYSVIITDANGCTKTVSGITVSQPAVLAAISSQTNVSCFGGSNGTATVSASGGTPGYTYLWSNGATAATASGLIAGTYSCTITDANGCTKTVNGITISQPAVLRATTSQYNVSCNSGSNGSATVAVTGGTSAYTYLWSNGATSATASGLIAGTYSCTITDANGCANTVNGITITQPATIDATVSVSSGVITANQTGASYQWVKCPNTVLFGESNSSYTPTASGDYKVDITLGGCTASSTCVTISSLGITKLESKIEIAVYPNPSSDVFFIESKASGTITVNDLLGKTIQTQKINSGTSQLDLSKASNGIYLLKITNENNESKTVKLIKK